MVQTDKHPVLEEAREALHYPDKVLSLCDGLLNSGELDSQPSLLAQAHLLRGGALRTMGQLELATAALMQGMSIAEAHGEIRRIAEAASQLALLHMHGHDYELSRHYLNIARHHYIECGSVEGQARTLYNMATLLMMEDRQEEAMPMLEEAMQGYAEAQSTIGMTHVLTAMAIIRLKQREFDAALDHLKRAKQLFVSLDQPKHALTVDLNIAECYIHMGQLNYARVHLTSVRTRAQAAEYHPLECRALLYLSNLEQLEHHPREAAEFYFQAREVAKVGGFESQFEAMQRDSKLQL